MKHIPVLLLFALALLAGIIFSGCKEVTSSGIPGDIAGTLQVLDTNNAFLKDNSGVRVSLEGTSYSTISNSDGKWSLTNIPAGTYTIVFSKENYATQKEQNFSFSGNGTYYYSLGGKTTYFYPIPNLFPNIVLRPFVDYIQIVAKDSSYTDSIGKIHRVYYDDTIITSLGATIFSSRSQRLYHNASVETGFYFSKVQNIDPLNPDSYNYMQIASNNDGTDTTGIAQLSLLKAQLLNSKFISGDLIYCCAFATTYASIARSNWFDPATNKTIYSGFSTHHSEVKSFILP
jgi:hypothetical protein